MLAEIELQPAASLGWHRQGHLLLFHHLNLAGPIAGSRDQRNHPRHFSVSGFNRTISQEPLLLKLQSHVPTRLRETGDLHQWVSHLPSPRLHHVSNLDTGDLLPCGPQIGSLCVAVLVCVHVQLQPFLKLFQAQHAENHTDNTTSFTIGDCIEDLFHLLGMGNRDLNGVRGSQGIQQQRLRLLLADIRLPDVPLREQAVCRESLRPIGETLVQPQVVPPLHCYQVAEPLVGQLVRDHSGDALLQRC
mmetsp:Transcript_10788/g.23819  ORF Transcript_10788/g.23819 Transcript_10788/m.23819 type:complete len:246 (+) Transcript_10788:1131-1868(+)